jgi:hypothetical protein
MSPNTMSAIRQLLTLVGGVGAALGWFTPDVWGSFTDNILQILSVAGPVMVVVSMVWSWWHNRQAKAAAAVSAVTQRPVVVTGLSTPTVAAHTVSPTAIADIAKAKAA